MVTSSIPTIAHRARRPDMTPRAERPHKPDNEYPTSDGRACDSDLHRDLMADLIATLDEWYAADPKVCVSGNLLIYYEKGNKRRRVAPDVFVARGVQKAMRPNYLLWEEKPLDVVIELTS